MTLLSNEICHHTARVSGETLPCIGAQFLNILVGRNLCSLGCCSLMGIPKIYSSYQFSLISRFLHTKVVVALWTDLHICCVSTQHGTGAAKAEVAPKGQPLPTHHHLMPISPSVYKGTGRVSCQRTGMLKCQPEGREWVNCGKNLPSDVPNLASHMMERENRNKTGKKSKGEK